MTIFSFFKPARSSAPVARDRLQILLQHERVTAGASDLIARLPAVSAGPVRTSP